MAYNISDFEVMAPVGCRESLAAAFQAGADSVYFGVGRLNMRAHSANHFTISDLEDIAAECRRHGVKSYLTVNTIVYDDDMAELGDIVAAARRAGVSAVIASDVAVMARCRAEGVPVHLSTQLNISNTEALAFWARYADVAVLARELTLERVARIAAEIHARGICGPAGRPMRIEMFCHGALCVAVSGKCYMSLAQAGRSANRGECQQVCRRAYTVTDRETGDALDVDGPYVMSPKDLKTIRFIDQMMEAGVSVFKIEGRARGPEYVYETVRCYKEAIAAVCQGAYTEARKDAWDSRLAAVFNRGFWDGYYQGRRLGEWARGHGSEATERKQLLGKVSKFYSRLAVAELAVEACPVAVGDTLLITGPTTGVCRVEVKELHGDHGPIAAAKQGEPAAVKTPQRVREGDKVFKIVKPTQQ